MPLINKSIPNLFNGVSQQSASIRQPSQCEIQENAYSSLVDGLHKRPPTTHVAKLSSTLLNDAYVHVINRDSYERYVVVITTGNIQVWDVNGNPKTVTFPNGVGYLSSSSPKDDFAIVTIADYTIIVNKTKTCTRLNGSTRGWSVVQKQKFSDLPATGVGNTLYKITGDPSNSFTGYYVYWNGSAYVETTYDNLWNSFDASTMPHRLVRNSDGTFTFSPIPWQDRLVGDEVSASPPSFVGRKISDVFFFRNRLGFLADENVCFSRAGNYFAFFPETVTQVLDSDPVDVAVSHVKVSILKHAIPFNRNLLLFSDLTQFMLTAQDTLTPKTVAIHQTTEFECSSKAKPVAAGSNVYFAVEKSGNTAVREYYVMPYQNSYDADDVTAHVPKYIPGGVFKMAASTNEDILFALTLNERNAIYTYKWYWKGEEKLQSSWSKWILSSNATILNMEMMGTRLYLVVQRPDGVFLEYIDIQAGLVESDLPILVLLDRKIKLSGTYSVQTGKTTWTLPYQESGVQVVLPGSFTSQKGASLTVEMPAPNLVEAFGDYSAAPVFLGIPYTMRYRFSPQYAKDQKDVSMGMADFRIRNFSLFYTKSGYFRVEVTPLARDTHTYVFNGKKLGVQSLVLGANQLESGVFKFPVMTEGVTGVIEIKNDSYLPSYFQSAEIEAFFNIRSLRR